MRLTRRRTLDYWDLYGPCTFCGAEAHWPCLTSRRRMAVQAHAVRRYARPLVGRVLAGVRHRA